MIAERENEVSNLQSDLADGEALIDLVEVLSGKKVPRPHKEISVRTNSSSRWLIFCGWRAQTPLQRNEQCQAIITFLEKDGAKFVGVSAKG